MRDAEYDFIRKLVYTHSRINLGSDKMELVSARLGKRLRATNLPSITDYCRHLQSPSGEEELSHLIDAISTNHTFFFRESPHFDFLRDHILPEMGALRQAENWPDFPIWSAASSSGEEPYSIAILLAQTLGLNSAWRWRIDATDISNKILTVARAGVYREDQIKTLPRDLLRTYFQKGYGPQEGKYRVQSALSERIAFRQCNLLEGELPYRHLFPVIFCRNVMIYFDRPTQEELVAKLTRQLIPGGYLIVGQSESLTGIRHSLATVKPSIYRKPASAR